MYLHSLLRCSISPVLRDLECSSTLFFLLFFSLQYPWCALQPSLCLLLDYLISTIFHLLLSSFPFFSSLKSLVPSIHLASISWPIGLPIQSHHTSSVANSSLDLFFPESTHCVLTPKCCLCVYFPPPLLVLSSMSQPHFPVFPQNTSLMC